MGRVKGTVLIDFVKTIRNDKTGAFNAYLTDQDREAIAQRILPSAWYPYETFKNCFNAAVKVLAKDDLEQVRKWGKLFGEAIITQVYRGLIKEGDPLGALQKYGTYLRNFFDFGEIVVEPLSATEAILRIRDFDPSFKPQYYMMLGWLERSIELCGAREIKVELLAATWEGKPETRIKLSWRM